MKLLFVLVNVVAVALCFKHKMLDENKTPKGNPLMSKTTDMCEECKMVVTKFAKAMADPVKVAEVKVILKNLCHEVSEIQLCQAIVNNLDYLIDEVEPYLKDPENVCKHFKMCDNSKIQQFHRIGVLYARRYMNPVEGANDLMCEECQFALSEFKNFLEEFKSEEKLHKLQQYISDYVCSYFGQRKGACDLVVEQYLPELLEELIKMLANTRQVCSEMKLCKTNYLVLDEPFENEQDFNAGILETVCAHLHPNTSTQHRVMCSRFVQQHDIKLTVNQHLVSHLCDNTKCDVGFSKKNKKNVMRKMLHGLLSGKSELPSSLTCNSCRTAAEFIKNTLSDGDFKQTARNAVVNEICYNLPEASFNLCENVCLTYTSFLLNRVVEYLSESDICREKIHVC